MPQALNDIADRLVASGLLSVGEIADLLADMPTARQKPPEQFVQALVTRGTLTAYQAECVLGGHIENLVLGNYVVLDKLGQGGMGLVLKARHRRMDRIVAIKVLSPEAVRTPAMVERFQREARAAAKLSHPNIVTAHDADEAHGTHFLVMEYVAGRDLSAIVKQQGPLSVPLSIECILQAACGFEYAHQQGIVHRDIKPGNLIVCRRPTNASDESASSGGTINVKILDMGLARIDSSPGHVAERELTTTGSVMGTIDYMAPEQALDAKQADARSDIYSLGCALFYLLTARPPFEADTVMRRLLAHRDAPIPQLMTLRPDSLPELQAVFQKMIAKNPADRFQSMTDLIRALSALRSRVGPPPSAELQSLGSSPDAIAGSGADTLGVTWVGSSVLSAGQILSVTVGAKEKIAPVGRSWMSQPVLVVVASIVVLTAVGIWFGQGRGKPDPAVKPPDLQTVKPVPPTVIPAKPNRPAEPVPVPKTIDRRVAEWVVDSRGYVHLDGQGREYSKLADLPQGDFKTTFVFLDSNSRVNDEDLKTLLGLDSLKRFTLYDIHRVTNAGIAQLKGISSLEVVDLRDTRMTNDGLKLFADFKHLEQLVLMGSAFTDEGVAHLEGCLHLRSLNLRLPEMTDNALPKIPGLLQRLAGLSIYYSQVTDAGLAHLAGLQHLQSLGLNALNITDDGLKHLSGLKNLELINLSQTKISDAGLIHLRGLNKLGVLELHETQVTAAGVAELQAMLPKCEIRFTAK